MACRSIKKQGVTPMDCWDNEYKEFYWNPFKNWRSNSKDRTLLKVSSDMHWMIKIK